MTTTQNILLAVLFSGHNTGLLLLLTHSRWLSPSFDHCLPVNVIWFPSFSTMVIPCWLSCSCFHSHELLVAAVEFCVWRMDDENACRPRRWWWWLTTSNIFTCPHLYEQKYILDVKIRLLRFKFKQTVVCGLLGLKSSVLWAAKIVALELVGGCIVDIIFPVSRRSSSGGPKGGK